MTDVDSFLADSSKRMLSIGVGIAYLERFLVEEFGLSRDQIVLTDQADHYLHERAAEGYKTYVFDMYKYEEWPKFGEDQFDLIIFPNSFFPTEGKVYETIEERYDLAIKALFCIAEKALPLLRTSGEIRISHDLLIIETALKLIERALKTHPPEVDIEIEYDEIIHHFTIRRRI